MKIRKSLLKQLIKEEIAKIVALFEGIHDPGILKAVFVTGGTGSGKTFVSNEILGVPDKLSFSVQGLKTLNSDTAYEHFLKKMGYGTKISQLDPKSMSFVTSDAPESPRGIAKGIVSRQKKLYTGGRLGLIIDGTGKDVEKIGRQRRELNQLGYDTYMIFVNTSLEKALDRNEKRDRTVPPEMAKKLWHKAQENIGKFQNMFKGNITVIDNSKDVVGGKLDLPRRAVSTVKKFVAQPVRNPIGKQWIKDQKAIIKNRSKQ